MQQTASLLTPRRALAGLALGVSLTLSGCADGGGLALNGAMFDWMGISESALSQKNTEPKLAERAPLVLPPSAERLPEPGSGRAAEEGDMNWPVSPEQRKVAEAKERERLHLAYCRGELNWEKRALDPSNPQYQNRSPYGTCPGMGGMTKGFINNDKN